MSDLISEIKERRILPAVGVYAAGCWVLVEIIDRLVERYVLSPYLTDIVFWGLYSLIPAVIMVSWSHGRPGKDKSTRLEKVGVPINLIATAGLLLTVFGGKDLGAAAELMTVQNEEGVTEDVYVPKQQYRQRLAVFFFKNRSGDPELDWLQHGAGELLTQDLQQNPFLSVASPFNWINGYAARMRSEGFPDGLDVPRGLLREIASDANRQYFVEGDIYRDGDNVRITARLWEADAMRQVAEISESGWDTLALMDDVSRQLREALQVPDAGRFAEDLPLADTYGESGQALRAYLRGMVFRAFDNDLPAAIAALDEALAIDPDFVLAWFYNSLNLFDAGDIDGAQAAAQRAQALDYRLPALDRGLLKLINYRLAGENDKLIRFLELQVQTRDDADSHYKLAGTLTQVGRLEEAKSAYLAALDRDPLNTAILLELSNLERATGNLDGAVAYAEQYREERPEDEDAILVLGDLLRDSGELDGARDAYEEAQVLADSPVAPLLRIADIAARQGDTQGARGLIEQADALSDSDWHSFHVRQAAARLESRLGRVDATIEQIRAGLEPAMKVLPPLSYGLAVYAPLAGAYLETEDYDTAMAVVQEGRGLVQPPLNDLLSVMEAYVLIRAGRIEEAREARARAQAIIDQLDLEMLRFQLSFLDAEFLEARGELVAAAETRQRALDSALSSALASQLAIEAPSLYADLIRAQVDAGLYEQAERTLNEAFRLDPNLPLLWLERARVQAASGNRPLAAASLQYALAIWAGADPDYRELKRALELAAEVGIES
jgi:tetratricopeptide (TPR) repeat protein